MVIFDNFFKKWTAARTKKIIGYNVTKNKSGAQPLNNVREIDGDLTTGNNSNRTCWGYTEGRGAYWWVIGENVRCAHTLPL